MVVIVILGIFVLLFFLVRYKGKKNLEANIAAEQQDVFEEMASFQNTIDYQGTTYQYRKDIVNILCIGVDKEEAMWERDDDGGSVGSFWFPLILNIPIYAFWQYREIQW